MSDGKFFDKSPIEQTIEDRVATLEAKIPSYQDRIAAYDRLFDEMHKLILKVEMEKEKTDGHRAAIDKMGESVANLHNSQVERINKLQSDLVSSNQSAISSTQGLTSLKESIAEKFGAVWSEISSMKDDHQEDLLSKCSNADVQEKAQSHAQQITNIAKELDAHRTATKNVLEMLKGNIAEIKDSMVKGSSYADDFAEIMKKISTFKADVLNVRDELPSRISQSMTQMESKLADLKCELTSKPSDIMDFKNEVAKKIEPIALDASSANIRSQNIDKKTFLLEKQLENVQLLIKKLELK